MQKCLIVSLIFDAVMQFLEILFYGNLIKEAIYFNSIYYQIPSLFLNERQICGI